MECIVDGEIYIDFTTEIERCWEEASRSREEELLIEELNRSDEDWYLDF